MRDDHDRMPGDVAAVLARYGEMFIRRLARYEALAAAKQTEREAYYRRYFAEVERLTGEPLPDDWKRGPF
jgi:hypothetical protein